MVDATSLLRFFSPFRTIEFLVLLSLIPAFSIAWQSAVLIFHYFFPIILGSIAYEAVLDKEGFRQGLKNAGWRYYVGVGMQFLGIIVFTMSTFNQDPTKIPEIAFYSLIVVAIGGGMEAFHTYTTKKFKGKKLSPQKTIFAVFCFTVVLFFMGLHAHSILLPMILENLQIQ